MLLPFYLLKEIENVALDTNGMKSLETVQVSLFVISESNVYFHEFNMNICHNLSLILF